MAYWRDFLDHENGDILASSHEIQVIFNHQFLATKLFAITVNSMADERTASTMTWLNSALRSSQKSSTLINQVQVRQSILMEQELRDHRGLLCSQTEAHRKPMLKFRDLLVHHDGNHDDGVTSRSSEDSVLNLELRAEDSDVAKTNVDTAADGWLDGDNVAVESDPHFLACNDHSLVGGEQAKLDVPHLLDLLSDKPLELTSSTESTNSIHKSSSRQVAAPVDWSFRFPQ
ncbi:hypothetical protein JVU11DRAFT_3682 [Chiua virens]|nr:hypothetical protein JVU11DRAFT_3682 [Chiua virens]